MVKKTNKDIFKDDAIIREISEDVKNDHIRAFWQKYGLWIIIFVAFCVTAAVSFETFKNWENKRNQEISNAYAVAVAMQNQGQLDKSLDILQNIAKNSNLYGDIANLQIANIYFKQNKPEEANKILTKIINESATEQIKEIAALKLAVYKLDNNASEKEIKKLLEPLTKDNSKSYNVAHELLAMLAIRDGNLEEAKNQYEKIVKSNSASETIKTRASDMIATIESDNSKKDYK